MAPAIATLPDAEGHASLGSATAPVTIVEFTDLQCPYCARFAAQTFPELKRQYIATGKVRFVSRDLPLPMHAQAPAAAVAARCAGRQGRYWEYREALFAAQSELGKDPFDRIATQVGLDPVKFAACRANPGTLPTDVQYDAALAGSIGIDGTPSFVFGKTTEGAFSGERLSGAQPFEVFDQRIKALLAP
jgi:protein-disulfide isomerase